MSDKSKKHQVSVYIDEARLEWLQDQVRKGTFKSVCEGVRESITVMKNLAERLDREAMSNEQT